MVTLDFLQDAILLAALQQELRRIMIALLKLQQDEQKQKKRNQRIWTRPWLMRKHEYGMYETLLAELQSEDAQAYRNFLRMDVRLFRQLLAHVAPKMNIGYTNYRTTIPPEIRLAITLRFLATGDSSLTLQYKHRVAFNTICEIIYHTCEAIISAMLKEFIPLPRMPDEWKTIAQKFGSRWNFYNTVGALESKHIAISCASSGGSKYFNYKRYHSIVLLALVDADYKFLFIDVGSPGSGSDGGIFLNTPLCDALEEGTLGLPPNEALPENGDPIPYFIVANDAFPLRTWLMKPFSQRGLTKQQRNFNYRLSRACRVVKNAFGILASRFRCLLRPLPQIPKRDEAIVMTTCILYNFLRGQSQMQVQDAFEGIPREIGNLATMDAKRVRDKLVQYYDDNPIIL